MIPTQQSTRKPAHHSLRRRPKSLSLNYLYHPSASRPSLQPIFEQPRNVFSLNFHSLSLSLFYREGGGT